MILKSVRWKSINKNAGKFIFTITQNKNSKQTDMKTNKTKNQKKELQAQVTELINAFALASKSRLVSIYEPFF